MAAPKDGRVSCNEFLTEETLVTSNTSKTKRKEVECAWKCFYLIEPTRRMLEVPSQVCEKIAWQAKEQKLFDKKSNKMEKIQFLCLNVVDDYNNRMGHINIADQL